MNTFRDYDNMGDVSFPANAKPFIKLNHVDGPMLQFSDGQIHWLTWRERFQLWRGKTDAEALQRKLRPRLTAQLEYYWSNSGVSTDDLAKVAANSPRVNRNVYQRDQFEAARRVAAARKEGRG